MERSIIREKAMAYKKAIALRDAAKAVGNTTEYKQHAENAERALDDLKAIRSGKLNPVDEFATRDDLKAIKRNAAMVRFCRRMTEKCKGQEDKQRWQNRADEAIRKIEKIRKSSRRCMATCSGRRIQTGKA